MTGMPPNLFVSSEFLHKPTRKTQFRITTCFSNCSMAFSYPLFHLRIIQHTSNLKRQRDCCNLHCIINRFADCIRRHLSTQFFHCVIMKFSVRFFTVICCYIFAYLVELSESPHQHRTLSRLNTIVICNLFVAAIQLRFFVPHFSLCELLLRLFTLHSVPLMALIG